METWKMAVAAHDGKGQLMTPGGPFMTEMDNS
jgi:hypothetical protein